ncbi:hypothetical protein HY990_06475 [Candidatus Micrarchaeota archaeon]|nr:hypothetical protein [Candidatus Micrarchaeota archaeon]
MPISNNPRNSKEFVALLRGQVAVEFLVYVSVFMLAVVLAFFVINQSQQAELPAKQNALAKETGQGFVDVLSLSVRAGAGFEYRYQFPKTLLNHPYSVNFAPLTPSNLMFFDWPGEYADFNYSYRLPTYKYLFSGRCLSDGVLHSNACDNVLVLRNDGENITLLQEEGSS